MLAPMDSFYSVALGRVLLHMVVAGEEEEHSEEPAALDM